MKYLQSMRLYELKNFQENRKGFWEDVDYAVKHIDGFIDKLRYLNEKYPNLVKEDSVEKFHDRLVDLHNRQIVPKRYSFSDWIFMWLNFLTGFRGLMKDMHIDDIKDFMFNQKVTLYRGTPIRKKLNYDTGEWEINWKEAPKLNKEYYSFTFDKDTAMRFTQPGWAQIVNTFNPMKDKSERNGYLYEIEVIPKDIHVVNDEGGEKEAVLKGPLSNYKVYTVKEGEIINEKI